MMRAFTQASSRIVRSFHSCQTCYAAKIIDGKAVAEQVTQEVKEDVDKWVAKGNRQPHLSVILVGDDPASKTYVRNKTRTADKVGITSETIRKPSDITQEQLLKEIQALNDNPEVDGILVQLPVPQHINERLVCDSVRPDKDVDGFHMINIGRLCLDLPTMIPATPYGVMELIRRYGINLFGKNAVVCGRSKNVGGPIAMMLQSDGEHSSKMGKDATTTVCHRYTPPVELAKYTKTADIIITAVGCPKLIKSNMIKEGAVLIDVGITRTIDPSTKKFRLVGDVDFEEVSKKAGYITPVPGGVGPMTVAMLMKNTLKAARKDISYT
ncbi:bifunctional methylenetetrahydrofolate dehydrogenase/cyclohydrolase, mitochondrial-like [Anneissia japonica]|uniref:bifunctional methylenetetrahydrofolate dehydrogenase/cyclohydrolase, mitochondrial-like n=1 Tax=Anneissia japonica TaxID=1529436 RepID=UPI001425A31E|nr:bifunctional methylenetetrahydrofolate dehydrogenase/cyclohydrolase, mitochondrial-like [Anneissia japonica]